MTLLHLIQHHWLIAVLVAAVIAVAVWFPAIGASILQFLLGTERGRYLLIAALVVGAGMWGWEARFAAGYAAAVADQAREAASSHVVAVEQAVTRDDKAAGIGAKTAAETGQRIDEGNKATAASQERIGERIAANPAAGGCAGPDPAVVREVREADARVQAAADHMRRMGAAAAGAAPAGGANRLAPVGVE